VEIIPYPGGSGSSGPFAAALCGGGGLPGGGKLPFVLAENKQHVNSAMTKTSEMFGCSSWTNLFDM